MNFEILTFRWMEACLKETLPPTTELEENLRNGVYLAKLCHFIEPDILPLNKIYDLEQKRYSVAGVQFRHTDNINHFLKCLKKMELPLVPFFCYRKFRNSYLTPKSFNFDFLCRPFNPKRRIFMTRKICLAWYIAFTLWARICSSKEKRHRFKTCMEEWNSQVIEHVFFFFLNGQVHYQTFHSRRRNRRGYQRIEKIWRSNALVPENRWFAHKLHGWWYGCIARRSNCDKSIAFWRGMTFFFSKFASFWRMRCLVQLST